jgi:hypothetical protein
VGAFGAWRRNRRFAHSVSFPYVDSRFGGVNEIVGNRCQADILRLLWFGLLLELFWDLWHGLTFFPNFQRGRRRNAPAVYERLTIFKSAVFGGQIRGEKRNAGNAFTAD